MNPEIKTCQNCKNDFTVEPDDFSFYEKMKVPAPHVCPTCRFQMKALFRNETTLYSDRTCDMCGKNIVTMYNPKSQYTVYCYDCFYGEKWDPQDYATDYDPNRSFVEQFKDFLLKVPKIATHLSHGSGANVNSEYVNMASGCKNCYLIFNSGPAEDLMYSRGVRNSRDAADMYFGSEIERAYEGINVQESNGVLWSQNSVGCVDSSFILNGSGVVDSFGCVNLRNISNYFLNKKLSSEEYKKTIQEIRGSYQNIENFKKIFKEFSLQFPRRENNNLKTVDSTGDYLFECKNVKESFEVSKSEDCKYIFSSKGITDSIGTIGYGHKCERLLECVATGHSSNVIGSYGVEHSQNIIWGFYISNCHNCLGCDALRHGEYSILNKKYSKEEYEFLSKNIIKELIDKNLLGLIMPPDLAPFSYNETLAQDNIPLSKEEALKLGYRWEDDIQITKGRETISVEMIPDHIDEVNESIINEVLKCSTCSRNYKITKQEFDFYKKMVIPVPRKCFYCRHQNRVVDRGPYKFWDRKCDHCDKDIKTNYAPERPEIVYCEKCYQQEVI